MKWNRESFYVLLMAFVLIFIDRLLFGLILWELPNESVWGTNYFFNFEYEYRSALKKKVSADTKRILIAGSSLAAYSFDAEKISDYLKEKTGEKISTDILSYAGMTPLDMYLQREKFLALKPDIIIIPVNFIDFRIHRAYILNPSGTNFDADENLLLKDAVNFYEAQQSKYLFPSEALTETFGKVSIEQSASYINSFIFLFYRYREIYLENLKNLYNHRFGRNTSYHAYHGAEIRGGISHLGWTGRKFGFIMKKYMQMEGFYIQIVPEILASGPLKAVFRSKESVQEEVFSSPGWKKIILKKDFHPEAEISAELSSVWIPYLAKEDRFDYAREEMGVRLQQTFGMERPKQNLHSKREERSEDQRYEKMSRENYREYFYYRLLADPEKRPGIGYLTALKNAKERISKEKFKPIFQFKYLQKTAEYCNENNIKVFIINNPENPLSLEWYSESEWYKDHLKFLKSLENKNVFFADIHGVLKEQDFSDFHHFTYPAMMRMNSVYGDIIGNKFSSFKK